jgi:hypothetical protein
MKHVLNKTKLAGAGKNIPGSEDTAGGGGGGGGGGSGPVLRPPKLGQMSYGASYSFLETLDLISDGPIKGLVNQRGEVVNGLEMLQGVYLNNTPISPTLKSQAPQPIKIAENAKTVGEVAGAIPITGFFNQMSNFDSDPLRFNPSGQTVNASSKVAPNWTKYNGDKDLFTITNTNSENAFVYASAFYGTKLGGDTVGRYFRGSAVSVRNNFTGFSLYLGQSKSTSVLDFIPKYTPTSPSAIVEKGSNQTYTSSNKSYLIYSDVEQVGSISDDYKFLFAYGNSPDKGIVLDESQSSKVQRFFCSKESNSSQSNKDSVSELAKVLGSEFATMSTLKTEGLDNRASGGEYQSKLIDRVFDNFNRIKGGQSVTFNGTANNWAAEFKSFFALLDKDTFIIYRPTKTSQTELNFSIIDPEGPQQTDKDNDFTYSALMDYAFELQSSVLTDSLNQFAFDNKENIELFDFIAPKIGTDGTLSQELVGFYLIALKANGSPKEATARGLNDNYLFVNELHGIDQTIVNVLQNITSLKYKQSSILKSSLQGQKFNYSNVLTELKLGFENQVPFEFFNKIYIDKVFNEKLFGPYRQEGNIQRILADEDMLSKNDFATTISESDREGSQDVRTANDDSKVLNYSDWAENLNPSFDEEASPVTHTVYNPNVEEVFVSLDIKNLRDSLHIETKPKALKNEEKKDDRTLEPSASYPALLEIRITTGTINPRTNEKNPDGEVRDYRFVALINSSTFIDLGNPETSPTDFPWIKLGSFQDSGDGTNKINAPIKLPTAISTDKAGVGEGNELTPHRYVEIKKLSCETNSSLVFKEVALSKITEIIPDNLTYPYSAIVGTKIDSRTIDGIPNRTFDCKLKLVQVPSNYFPERNSGLDKRYYSTQEEFNNASKEDKRVYIGDWDGTFNKELQWTDNPAWILYDLLTNKRYGLGQHLDKNKINIWELYKIGRFCDAVDDDGIFKGVSDGQGGLEPRFSCNVIFKDNEKIYDTINTVAAIFRGSVFFGDNEINFVDDRPRDFVNLITNESVKGGNFVYSNNRRDETYNVIEITYNDRFDNFLPKIETIEDEEDIGRRGVFKTRIQGVGLTSRGMARRAALHHMFHKIDENQTVTFTAGLPTLLSQPGDLINVEDELKSNSVNFGKVLGVNSATQEIRISNEFISSDMTGNLTIYNPTGIDSISSINTVAEKNRERKIDPFTITGDVSSSSSTSVWTDNFTGAYDFSGYIQGYTGNQGGFEQYATYTGTGSNVLYFDTTLTGWVFSTGGSFERHNDYAKFISQTTTVNDNTTLKALRTGILKNYDTSTTTNRGSNTFNINEAFSGSMLEGYTKGILESEITVTSPSQVLVLNLTGTSNPINQTYGTLVSGVADSQTGLLDNIVIGSPCKFQIKDSSPATYKILDIKEDNPNEYVVSASIYDTGKYDLIEKNISIQKLSDTFSYRASSAQVNNLTYHTLSPVTALTLTTGTGVIDADASFSMTGTWTDPNGSNATGYFAVLTAPGSFPQFKKVTTTSAAFDELTTMGTYTLKVQALGAASSPLNFDNLNLNAYYNSSISRADKFVIVDDLVSYDKSFLGGFTVGGTQRGDLVTLVNNINTI